MMRPSSPLSPPDTAADLLLCLREARLLSSRRALSLARRWAARPQPGGCEGRVRELIAAHVLTRYQAAQVLAGRARRLRLGPYRILDRLGGGGMGHVYKAEHILMRRVVALKIVARLPRLSEAPAAGQEGERSRRALIARFRREVRSAARMSHPNVVTAYDAGAARDFLFLVMEFVDGIDLGRYVTENGPLPVPLACEAVRQAALALQYAHDRGLVHRDIKPDNLLLTWPGPGSVTDVGSLPSLPDGTSGEGTVLVKLLDLGLALPTHLPAERVEPAGTPDFMAPEQANRSERVDERSDLYSLGCTFYYLLTGHVPYPGGTCTEKLLRHGLDVPGPLSASRPDVPPTVAAVVERLMAKRPEDRYPGPAAVVDVLRALAENGWNLGAPPPERHTGEVEKHAGAAPEERQPIPLLPAKPDEARADERPNNAIDETPSMPSLPQLPPLGESVALPAPRRRLPRPAAVMAAVLAGPLLALAARELPTRLSAETEVVSPPAVPAAFRLELSDREFVTLAEAISAAAEGDTITIRGPGPHLLQPIDVGNKSLLLRAAEGIRPRLRAKDPAAKAPWQALLTTTRLLTLKGLDLATAADAPLIAATGATLRLTDCRLAADGVAPAVVARQSDLVVHSCRIRGNSVALAIDVDGTTRTVDLTDSSLRVADGKGTALAVWAAEATPAAEVHLHLEHNVVDAARVVSCRALPGRLHVDASRNEFTFCEALASFSGYADDSAWRRRTTWKDRENRCHATGYWVRVDGRSVDVSGDAAWQQLWSEPDDDLLPVASAPSAGMR